MRWGWLVGLVLVACGGSGATGGRVLTLVFPGVIASVPQLLRAVPSCVQIAEIDPAGNRSAAQIDSDQIDVALGDENVASHALDVPCPSGFALEGKAVGTTRLAVTVRDDGGATTVLGASLQTRREEPSWSVFGEHLLAVGETIQLAPRPDLGTDVVLPVVPVSRFIAAVADVSLATATADGDHFAFHALAAGSTHVTFTYVPTGATTRSDIDIGQSLEFRELATPRLFAEGTTNALDPNALLRAPTCYRIEARGMYRVTLADGTGRDLIRAVENAIVTVASGPAHVDASSRLCIDGSGDVVLSVCALDKCVSTDYAALTAGGQVASLSIVPALWTASIAPGARYCQPFSATLHLADGQTIDVSQSEQLRFQPNTLGAGFADWGADGASFDESGARCFAAEPGTYQLTARWGGFATTPTMTASVQVVITAK